MKKFDFFKVFLAAMVVAAGAWAQAIDWNADEITITTAAQLKEFAARNIGGSIGGNNFRGKTIKLGNNIDLNGNADNQWTPIGGLDPTFWVKNLENEEGRLALANKLGFDNIDECMAFLQNLANESGYDNISEETLALAFSFQGTFDGAGFVISGVYVNHWDNTGNYDNDDNDDYKTSFISFGRVGLFGMVGNNGTIKNLGVIDSYITSYISGGLAGANYGTIENCYTNVNVKVRAGGLAGLNYGTIENCYAVGNVTGFFASGLVAWNEGVIRNSYATGNVEDDGSNSVGGLVRANVGTIENCYATGNVKGGMSVGGLVGSNGGTITNCYATGNVTEIGENWNTVGGLVGSNSLNRDEGIITNCYATGNVTALYADVDVDWDYNNNRVGGLVGSNGSIITNSYYDKETTGQDDEGKGDGKTTAEMKRQATYTNWDFQNIWAIDAVKNNGYPYLGIIDEQKTPVAKKAAKKTTQAGFAGITNGQINLNLKAGVYTAQIYNLQGRLIRSVDINAVNGINATGLRTDNLSKGIFILNVKQAGTSVLKHKIAVK